MDYLGEIIALGIDAIIFGVCTRLYFHSSLSIKLLEAAQRLGVNPDIHKLTDDEKKYTIYQGKVQALGESLKCSNRDYTGVILRKTISEHSIARNATGFWTDQKKLIHESYNAVPFLLKKGQDSIEILEALSANLLDLDTVYNKFESNNLTLMGHIMGFYTGVRPSGIEIHEQLLKEGTLLIAVGEVSISKNGYIQISPSSSGYPYYLTTMSISSLLGKLKEEQRTYRLLTIIFGSIGLALSLLLVFRIWRTKRELKKEKRKIDKTRSERRRNVRDGKELTENERCVVCGENPKEIIILPCGHVCLCEDCAEHVTKFCPLCRSPIASQNPAFI